MLVYFLTVYMSKAAPYFEKLLRFIDCYRQNFRHENGIYFWHDDAAIGVDNDPSTFYRPVDSSGSIYLNCMMYKELEAVCYIGELLDVDVSLYKEEKQNLRKSVQENCYDEKDKIGVMIHRYGPHIFHTNNKEVVDLLAETTRALEKEGGDSGKVYDNNQNSD